MIVGMQWPILIAAGIGFVAASAIGYILHSWRAAAWDAALQKERREHAEQIARALEETAQANARLAEKSDRVVTIYNTRSQRNNAIVNEVVNVIQSDPTPALHDPRCAWPDGVLDAVNRARAGAETGSAESAEGTVRTSRTREPRVAR